MVIVFDQIESSTRTAVFGDVPSQRDTDQSTPLCILSSATISSNQDTVRNSKQDDQA